MPLDPHAQRFLRALAIGGRADMRAASVEARREGLARLMQIGREEYPVAEIREISLPGGPQPLAARLYVPTEPSSLSTSAPAPGILYLHGGGLVAGNLDTHEPIARALCRYSGLRLLSLGYRLAPEAPFPSALEDVRRTLEYLARQAPSLGFASDRLVLCGDSAGGTLAAVSAAAPTPMPLALLVLLCPILDYANRSASRRELASGYFLDEATLEHDLEHYLPPGIGREDPRISPLLASTLAGMPRTVLHTAEFDPLRDEALDYFKRLEAVGAGLSYTCHPGMIHLFYGLGAVIPRAREALEQVGREIRAALE